MVILERWSVLRRENDHVLREVLTLMEGEWSCYEVGQFKEGRMVMLQTVSLQWREKGHQRVRGGQFNGGMIKKGEWLCYRGGLFNGGGMVMLERWPV